MQFNTAKNSLLKTKKFFRLCAPSARLSDLQKLNAHVGVWYNHEDGKTYLDTSYRFNDVDSALQFARDNNQLAIFDLATYEEIRL